MLYNPRDRYVGRSLQLYGEFSEGEAALFRQLVEPGDTVVEIGANLGALTVPLARFVGDDGRVIACEPQRIVFQQLCANLALNGLSNVDARQVAVSDCSGTILVPRLDYTAVANYGGVPLGQWEAGETVPVVTVDCWELPRLHLLKVDVEGMECEVLRGAMLTIERCRPLIYVENDREEHTERLMWLLRSSGYRIFEHHPPLFNPDNWARNRTNVFGTIGSLNLLCTPAEVEADLRGFRELT
jgi:FkbM family methyltransferase